MGELTLEFAIIEINYVSSSFWSQKKEEGLLREVQTLEFITCDRLPLLTECII